MPAQYTRADCLREYLTGASTDGGIQANPNNSLGGARSSTEAVSLGIQITNPITNVAVLYASGTNPPGPGTLVSPDGHSLTWQAFGESSPGASVSWSGGTQIQIVESGVAGGEYLRILATPPFSIGAATITLSVLYNNLFGFDNLTPAQASAGEDEYRASIVRNEMQITGTVIQWQRWLALQGTPHTTNGPLGPVNVGFLNLAGGTPIDWPAQGWVQIQKSDGTVREVVYYGSKTTSGVNVVARALFGTVKSAGLTTDKAYPVPGTVIGIDFNGISPFGSFIQSIPDPFTPPVNITWNMGVTAGTGLQIGNMNNGQQVGIWYWRSVPPGSVATPSSFIQYGNQFSSF